MRTRSLTRTTKPLRTAGLLLAWVSLALLPLAATGCGSKGLAKTSEEEQSQVVEVATVNPQRMDLTREIDQPGYLRPYYETAIYTKIPGFAKEPKVDKGDRIKKGQLLVEVYVPEVVQDLRVKAAKIEQARADLKQAKEAAQAAKAGREAARAEIQAKLATIHSAESQVVRWQAEDERSRRLVGKGIFDQQTADEVINQLRTSEASREEARAKWMSAKALFDQASAQYNKTEADVEVAAANFDVAKAAYDQWKDWLSYSEIRAPYDGVVTVRHANTGDFLQPATSGSTSKSATPLFMVMQTDIMRLTVEVPEIDAGLIKKGDTAKIRFQAKTGEVPEIEAKVTRDSYALDERARTLSVEVYLDNPDGKLMPGMYANVTILAKLRNALTLPADCIMSDILADGDRSYCYVVEDGKVHKTFLEVGAHCDEGVQVLRKQRPGGKWEKITGKEAVVVDPKKNEDAAPSRLVGPKALLDGQPVQVKTTETP